MLQIVELIQLIKILVQQFTYLRLLILRRPDGLKVMFDAYRHATNDIRVMYRIFRIDAPPQYQIFELFPGFENLDSHNVIDPAKNNGKPDRRILSSQTEDDYKEYEFNVKNLPQFNGFQIKIVMSGTNFAYVPKIRDLRAIASI